MPFQLLTEWWFWLGLPVALVLFVWLDRGLSSYSGRYWRRRGQEPPPNRSSYLDAGRFVLYAVFAACAGAFALADADFVLAAVFAAAAVICGWLALERARRNII